MWVRSKRLTAVLCCARRELSRHRSRFGAFVILILMAPFFFHESRQIIIIMFVNKPFMHKKWWFWFFKHPNDEWMNDFPLNEWTHRWLTDMIIMMGHDEAAYTTACLLAACCLLAAQRASDHRQQEMNKCGGCLVNMIVRVVLFDWLMYLYVYICLLEVVFLLGENEVDIVYNKIFCWYIFFEMHLKKWNKRRISSWTINKIILFLPS